MGGEKQNVKVCQHFRTGSPPRGRGKAGNDLGCLHDVGITPAWAGKRPWMPSDSSSSRDHPRVGGEKSLISTISRTGRGSPPRRRGKDGWLSHCSPCPGITPAWAGKRLAEALPFREDGDHPRMGGEKQTGTVYAVLPYGSPPHERGKEAQDRAFAAARRITPARAGKRGS